MASGKTTVGRLLADRWSLPFYDLDARIGDVPALFAAEGEAGFRRRERAALDAVVAMVGEGEAVLALGGGAVHSEENRTLLAHWRVIVLMARPETLRARIGAGEGRPLADRLEALLDERRATYAAAGPVVWTDGIAPAGVVARVEALC
jgi:shikimate kinase